MTLTAHLLARLDRFRPAPVASAHCDGPCGVYDPASIRIAAEAVVSMTNKLLALDMDAPNALNSYVRYVDIKEEQAQIVKDEMAILWSDYFKPEHLEAFPDLHDVFWKGIKAASATKVGVSTEACAELMAKCEEIHNMFWQSKGRDVPWTLANP